ncbi:hypothetical protein B0T22DRAFT_461254 [Podospora appendiculata]|uniref:Uncharacterized protein n=1 Tax=Podospora appendiculata TaxID=314037 RepID=A0AAE1CDC8_9PEZI|nr:hypothetical protein B0T22DRAFT_461254 [Podospora appendiculata]
MANFLSRRHKNDIIVVGGDCRFTGIGSALLVLAFTCTGFGAVPREIRCRAALQLQVFAAILALGRRLRGGCSLMRVFIVSFSVFFLPPLFHV